MGYNTPKQTVSQFQLKGRYARQYLSFAGKSSKDFLLYLSGPGVYDSPAADVESTSVPQHHKLKIRYYTFILSC